MALAIMIRFVCEWKSKIQHKTARQAKTRDCSLGFIYSCSHGKINHVFWSTAVIYESISVL